MPRYRIRKEACRHSVIGQRAKHFVRLCDRNAHVARIAENQRWRRDVPRVCDRRLCPVERHVVSDVGRARNLRNADGNTVVRKRVLVNPIVDGCARDRRLPNVVMPFEPRRHIAAVRPARNADARRIHVRSLFDCRDSRHHVAARPSAGIVENGMPIFLALVIAAAIIRVEHQEAARGQQLIERAERKNRRRIRTAVNDEHERIGFAGVITGRIR